MPANATAARSGRCRLVALAAAGIATALVAGCVPATTSGDAAQALNDMAPAAAQPAALALRTDLPPAPPPDPAQLMGLDRGALEDLLGEPNLRRQEPPAEVWLYTSESCAFHVYLYRSADDGGYRVTHYDAVARYRRLTVDERCFARLMARADQRQRDS